MPVYKVSGKTEMGMHSFQLHNYFTQLKTFYYEENYKFI